MPLITLSEARQKLLSFADIKKAKILARFFKTAPGEYAYGDFFLGVTVPQIRLVLKDSRSMRLKDVKSLLHSKYHEERLLALLLLVDRYESSGQDVQETIYQLYLDNTRYINNWDLVDLTAHRIVGAHLEQRDTSSLLALAHSGDLWQRRIAIIATFHFIRKKRFDETLKVASILLNDTCDLIHKAVGWMLREVGKRDLAKEESFLRKYYQIMPRTMLRYAIERFPEKKRLAYLKNKF